MSNESIDSIIENKKYTTDIIPHKKLIIIGFLSIGISGYVVYKFYEYYRRKALRNAKYKLVLLWLCIELSGHKLFCR